MLWPYNNSLKFGTFPKEHATFHNSETPPWCMGGVLSRTTLLPTSLPFVKPDKWGEPDPVRLCNRKMCTTYSGCQALHKWHCSSSLPRHVGRTTSKAERKHSIPSKSAQDLQTPKKLLCTQSASPAGELAGNDLAHCNLQQQPAHVCALRQSRTGGGTTSTLLKRVLHVLALLNITSSSPICSYRQTNEARPEVHPETKLIQQLQKSPNAETTLRKGNFSSWPSEVFVPVVALLPLLSDIPRSQRNSQIHPQHCFLKKKRKTRSSQSIFNTSRSCLGSLVPFQAFTPLFKARIPRGTEARHGAVPAVRQGDRNLQTHLQGGHFSWQSAQRALTPGLWYVSHPHAAPLLWQKRS